MQSQRTRLIVSYREKIRPVARRVAIGKGLSVVLIPSDNILYSDSGVDITNDVIDELLKSGDAKALPAPAPTAPPATATNPAATTPAAPAPAVAAAPQSTDAQAAVQLVTLPAVVVVGTRETKSAANRWNVPAVFKEKS